MSKPDRTWGWWAKRLATAPLVLLAAILIFLEDFLWDELAQAFGLLARLPLWARLEKWIAGLPVWAAIPIFLVPMATLVPLKIVALWLMGNHHLLLGIEIILLAKIVGTAIAARLFFLLKPTLLSVGWFARLYDWIIYWRERIMTRLHGMLWWRFTAGLLRRLLFNWRQWRAREGFLGRLKRRLRGNHKS